MALKKSHPEKMTEVTECPVEDCGFSLCYPSSFRRHFEKKHLDLDVNFALPSKVDEFDKKRPCPEVHCSSQFKMQVSFISHLMEKHGASHNQAERLAQLEDPKIAPERLGRKIQCFKCTKAYERSIAQFRYKIG